MEKIGDTSVSRDGSDKVGNSLIFCKDTITTPSDKPLGIHVNEGQKFSVTELNRIKVFKHLENTEPSTRYRLAKETGISYSAIKQMIRDMVFAGLVHEKIMIGENNRTYKILSIPKETDNG